MDKDIEQKMERALYNALKEKYGDNLERELTYHVSELRGIEDRAGSIIGRDGPNDIVLYHETRIRQIRKQLGYD